MASGSVAADPTLIFDSAIRADPYPLYGALLERDRVVQDAASGTWFLLGYEECARVLRETEAFSAERGGPGESMGPMGGRTMLGSDPPDHTRLRGTVARAFTHRAIAALEPRIREVARRLLEPLRPGEPFEVVGQLAVPLPVMIIAELLGVERDDWPHFREWSEGVISVTGRPGDEAQTQTAAFRAAMDSAQQLRGYFARVIEERRREPRQDLISGMVSANAAGVLTPDELLAACVLLLIAGNETTTNLISNMALSLARHPDQRRRLVDDPSLIANAVEEVMRFDGPVQFTGRRPMCDVDLGGHRVPKDSFVHVVLAAANRDPARFAEPDRLDVGRADAGAHLGFGGGIHYCLGAPQARLEARIAYEILLAMAPDFELAEPGLVPEYGPNPTLRGLRELHIVPTGA
jgi:cytochrome P450